MRGGGGGEGPAGPPPPPRGVPHPAHLEEGGVGVGGQVGELQVALHHLAALVEVPQGLVVAFGAGGTQQLHVGARADCGDGSGSSAGSPSPGPASPPRGNRAGGGGTGLRRKRCGIRRRPFISGAASNSFRWASWIAAPPAPTPARGEAAPALAPGPGTRDGRGTTSPRARGGRRVLLGGGVPGWDP